MVFAHHSLVQIPAGQIFLLILFLFSLQVQKGLHRYWAHHNPLTDKQLVLMLFCPAGYPNESPESGDGREAGRLLFSQGHLARAFLGSSESNTEAACPVMGFPMSPNFRGWVFNVC